MQSGADSTTIAKIRKEQHKLEIDSAAAFKESVAALNGISIEAGNIRSAIAAMKVMTIYTGKF